MVRKLYWGFAIPIILIVIVGVFFMMKKDTRTYKRVVVNVELSNPSPDADVGMKRIRADEARKMQRWTLTGHTGKVFSVAFSPDGKLLASGGNDNTIRVWDVASGEQLQEFTGHTDGVVSVTFSPDGKTLAGGAYLITLWDVETGTRLHTLKGHDSGAYSVAFRSDGKMLASAGKIDPVKLWDVKRGKHLYTLLGHDQVYCVAFSPDGEKLASGSWENTVMLWKLE